MELAFEQLIGQGVLGVFLILVIIHFKSEIKGDREKERLKSEEHAKTMREKDEKIQALNDQIRLDAIENVTLFRDLQQNLRELVTELKIRNND